MKKVVLGGTFDRLHKGHEGAIRLAFSVGDSVVFGVTSPELTKQKQLSNLIQPYSQRAEGLRNFLKKEGRLRDGRIMQISRMEGDADTNENYDGLVVIASTKSNALKINKARRRQGIKELVLIELPLVLGEDGKPITAGRIRAGLIDRMGKPLQKQGARNKIRANIARILEQQSTYGYQIHKKYNELYGKISLRLIYYHLSKGVEEGLFEAKAKTAERGGYSWGGQVERIYYTLGPKFS